MIIKEYYEELVKEIREYENWAISYHANDLNPKTPEKAFNFVNNFKSKIEDAIEIKLKLSGMDPLEFYRYILKSTVNDHYQYQAHTTKLDIEDYCRRRESDILYPRDIYKVDSRQRHKIINNKWKESLEDEDVTEHIFDLPNHNTYDEYDEIVNKKTIDELDNLFITKLLTLELTQTEDFLDYQFKNTEVDKKSFLNHLMKPDIISFDALIKKEKVRKALLNWHDKKAKLYGHESSNKDQKQVLNDNSKWNDEDLEAMIENKVQKEFNSRIIQTEITPAIVNEESFLTRKEAAKKLRVSLVTLDRWQKQGKIKFHRFGSRIRYKWSEIEGSKK